MIKTAVVGSDPVPISLQVLVQGRNRFEGRPVLQ